MQPLVRRSLILSVIGAMAVMLGIVLGRFTMAGVTGIARPMNEMAALQAFARQQEAQRVRPIATSTPHVMTSSVPEAHSCQGCDANRYRDREMALLLASQPVATEAPPSAEPAMPTRP